MADSTTTADMVSRVVVDVTLDSISQDPRSSMRQPVLDSVRGAAWRILMAPNYGRSNWRVTGHMVNLVPTELGMNASGSARLRATLALKPVQ